MCRRARPSFERLVETPKRDGCRARIRRHCFPMTSGCTHRPRGFLGKLVTPSCTVSRLPGKERKGVLSIPQKWNQQFKPC